MASVFVTGSSDGIGRETAATLARAGHRVTLHARSAHRAEQAREAVPSAVGVLVGDLASLAETRALAAAATEAGPFDVVIHNAGVYTFPERAETRDGLERVFQINVLAPYLLTALLPRPRRLVYLSSGGQASGEIALEDLQFRRRPWSGLQAYCDSKLHDVLLAFAVARRWPEVISNAVDPGWVRSRMGGSAAPDSVADGADTPVWLASSDEQAAVVSGRYLSGRRARTPHHAAADPAVQDALLAACAALTGVELPS
ncbi:MULTISPECIES: SDR family NAD(P)-dependent oxidoreductase [Actinoalloteichus]|uniref:Short-chain dehydrogenase n=1 Tax=Actinoalloteichus fjordicus TaxID=1612552 RepID=A0AAC9LH07_9PSEU|nr:MULTISPECIES: SDR family NAD(P)-dependent oxidoreductase [Actinoalloteichus]APU17733.1 dehydrogenase of unknown specificity, short-chain alcohol dehydrogenase like [Actinoalloteichus fjordicus]APU23811.1 dehydrogenase of unknown specificity, short-chain alcohol dehydrogenase like [Actinoalloteichus sp. GBA129-24]